MHKYTRVWQVPILYKSTTINPYPTGVTITDSTRGWPLLGLLTLPTAGEREQVWKDTQTKQSVYAHVCMLYSVQQKKGGWCVRAVVTIAPHCIAGQDRWPPVTTTPWPKAICFFLISNPIIVQSSNQSLYSMFALLHGSSTLTQDKRWVWCM